MKQLFHITNSSTGNEQQVLSLQLGEKHTGFAVTNKAGDYLYELAYSLVEECDINSLTEFFSAYPCLQQSFHQVKIGYDYPQATLIPSAVHVPGESGALLKTMFGTMADKNIISELIPEWQFYNIYAFMILK